MKPKSTPLPTFVIIGAQKSGTRWLRSSLGKHPDVYVADRELEFFNGHFGDGVQWYIDQFDGWSGESAIGEATPGYMFWRHRPDKVSARIDGLLSPVRLLALLRNPVDRARSAIIHHARRGSLDPDLDVEAWLRSLEPEKDKLGIVSGGWYGASLEPYFERFGDDLLVIPYDDVTADRERVYLRSCAHIGVEEGFVPADLSRVVNSGEADLRESRPESAILRWDDDIRQKLYRHFEDDIALLEKISGLDLSGWRVG